MTVQTLVRHGPRRTTDVAARYAVLAAVAIAAASIHLRRRPATLCPLRALTGVPCPLCGGTTAAVDLGHGDVVAALKASPLAVGLFGFAPLIGRLALPQWWTPPLRRWLAVGAVLLFAEVWQLARFGLIHV